MSRPTITRRVSPVHQLSSALHGEFASHVHIYHRFLSHTCHVDFTSCSHLPMIPFTLLSSLLFGLHCLFPQRFVACSPLPWERLSTAGNGGGYYQHISIYGNNSGWDLNLFAANVIAYNNSAGECSGSVWGHTNTSICPRRVLGWSLHHRVGQVVPCARSPCGCRVGQGLHRVYTVLPLSDCRGGGTLPLSHSRKVGVKREKGSGCVF